MTHVNSPTTALQGDTESCFCPMGVCVRVYISVYLLRTSTGQGGFSVTINPSILLKIMRANYTPTLNMTLVPRIKLLCYNQVA